MNEPKLTHVWEQALASMMEMAAALGTYRRELEAAGFDKQEALTLCLGLQQALLIRRADK